MNINVTQNIYITQLYCIKLIRGYVKNSIKNILLKWKIGFNTNTKCFLLCMFLVYFNVIFHFFFFEARNCVRFLAHGELWTARLHSHCDKYHFAPCNPLSYPAERNSELYRNFSRNAATYRSLSIFQNVRRIVAAP